MEQEKPIIDRAMELARNGKGRRLLNTLKKKSVKLPASDLDDILSAYRDIGLAKEVENLKTRRGILTDKAYDALASKVKAHCSTQSFDQFAIALRDLISCGIKMNPTKMDN